MIFSTNHNRDLAYEIYAALRHWSRELTTSFDWSIILVESLLPFVRVFFLVLKKYPFQRAELPWTGLEGNFFWLQWVIKSRRSQYLGNYIMISINKYNVNFKIVLIGIVTEQRIFP